MSNFAWNGGGGYFAITVFVTKLFDWIVFYAVSAIFQSHNGGVTKLNHKSDRFISPTRIGSRITFFWVIVVVELSLLLSLLFLFRGIFFPFWCENFLELLFYS